MKIFLSQKKKKFLSKFHIKLLDNNVLERIEEPVEDSFSLINNPLNFSQLNSFSSFDLNGASSFMQSSFSDNHSSPSTPPAFKYVLHNGGKHTHFGHQHSNASTNSSDMGQFNQESAVQNANKSNPLLSSHRFSNDSDEEDFINWENLLWLEINSIFFYLK